jgi:hypothetical protein
MNKWSAYGSNIIVKPVEKNKIIGDTSKYYLYGDVLSVGHLVKNIKVGDTIGYVLWGIKDIVMADGQKHFFVQDNPDFILGILKKDE